MSFLPHHLDILQVHPYVGSEQWREFYLQFGQIYVLSLSQLQAILIITLCSSPFFILL